VKDFFKTFEMLIGSELPYLAKTGEIIFYALEILRALYLSNELFQFLFSSSFMSFFTLCNLVILSEILFTSRTVLDRGRNKRTC